MKLKDVHFFGKILIDFQLVLYGLEVDAVCLTVPKLPKIIYILQPGNCCLSGFGGCLLNTSRGIP
jgi:hypothetical protein